MNDAEPERSGVGERVALPGEGRVMAGRQRALGMIEAAGPAVWVKAPAALGGAIAAADCMLAICVREAEPALAVLDRLAFAAIDPIDVVMPVEALATDGPAALGIAGYPSPPVEALAADIVRLATLHAAWRSVARVRIRLEWIVTDACRRFHADYVTTRLLVTYVGAGTQWIEAARPHAIRHIPPHAVALLKGRLLAPEPVVLHRSPPVANTGEARLLLVIDPVDAD